VLALLSSVMPPKSMGVAGGMVMVVWMALVCMGMFSPTFMEKSGLSLVRVRFMRSCPFGSRVGWTVRER